MIVKTETFLKLSVFSVHLKYIIGSCNCISTTNISYAYDALGQLIRVNDETDTTSGATGTTWTYEYDRGGNIISKSRYAYTTGVLGTALETIVYGYGDYNWMDKMTHYNYLGVSYDDIGNPTSFNGWNCTWEKGRQLKQMTDNSVNTIYYKYNADGLRVQKRKVTIYGSDVTTNYILHGKNIVHMTQGTDTLHFWYDAQGRPAIVEYNGTKYAYIHNLQGDIVGIIDSTGAEVVQYTYDAWGKVLSTAGTMASSLGTVQPFRYRGYVYDVETGLYYLRSRYYNPEWGRFINADSLIRGNLFAYCYNMPNLYVDNSGRTPREIIDYNMRVLVEYLKKEGNESDAQEYWFGSLLGDMVNIREKPGLGHDIIYCIENVHDVRAIYINEHWEWDQPRNNQKKSKKLKASPVIIWFPVLVFTNRDKTPYKGYIAANYVSPLYGLNKEERQIKPITFDFKTTSNSRSIEKGGPVSYFPFFVEEINGEEWLYCSTGFGTGWIKRTVIEDD